MISKQSLLFVRLCFLMDFALLCFLCFLRFFLCFDGVRLNDLICSSGSISIGVMSMKFSLLSWIVISFAFNDPIFGDLSDDTSDIELLQEFRDAHDSES